MIDFFNVCRGRLNKLITILCLTLNDGSLKEALLYVCQKPGKQVRALLLYTLLKDKGFDFVLGDKAAIAIELLHLYSLVHDDLPMMDNDIFRRGQPCVHVIFGEALGVLVGDALLPLALQQVIESSDWSTEKKIAILDVLTDVLGPKGIVYGQSLDIANLNLSIEQLEDLYIFKTGLLFGATFKIAGIIANQTSDDLLELMELGKIFGLLFQIHDDLSEIGVKSSSDMRNCRNTYVGLSSVEIAKRRMQELQQTMHCKLINLNLQDTIFSKLLLDYQLLF